MRKLLFSAILLFCLIDFAQAQSYLPLTGGTLSGNLSFSASNLQVQAPYYGFNYGAPQPSNSNNVSIFTNSSTTTLDFTGWSNGWRFVPSNTSSYPMPVVTFSSAGAVAIGSTTNGLPAGGIALTLRGPNTPAGGSGFQDISYSFNSAGSSRIRAYRGGSWDTYLQFLVNKVSQGSDAPVVAMHIDQTGYVGIGTTSPGSMLHVKGNSTDGNINIETANANAKWQLASIQSTTNFAIVDALGGTAPFVINKGAPNNAFTISNNGNIIIGKLGQSNTAYKLDVAGATRMDKVVVNTTGADFVFDSSYTLKTLSQVEGYIRQNKHLPEIESAAEMQKAGVDVGQNQTKLLQKIEELTLYLIEQNKKQEQLQEEVEVLKKKLEITKDNLQDK